MASDGPATSRDRVIGHRTVGVLGGTGPAGRALAARLASAGHAVLVGSRDVDRAAEAAGELRAAWPGHDLAVRGVANMDAAAAELLVLAAPWEPALRMCDELAPLAQGKTVITMANALTRIGTEMSPLTMPRGSVTAEVEARLPGCRVVGAFHHLPSGPLSEIDRELGVDVLVCGSAADARREVIDLLAPVRGIRGVDAGGLASAGAIEAFTAVLVQINIIHRTHSMLRLEGSLDAVS
ncbi:MAG: NADPH-dependent F420 reductase [Nitriliruptoraceae bacterium]|jgi:NADPH-dependent F420 reductase